MQEMIQSAIKQVKDLYDIEPSNIEVVFDNKGLRFFEAGCTWIDENKNAYIQIKKKKSLFYSLEEVLAHEYVHALRAHLDEPKFEEFIAYKTSKSKLRAFIGPMISSQKEVYLFLFSLLLQFFYYPFVLIPLFLILVSLMRVQRRINQWKRAKLILEKYLSKEKKAEFILFWLKDKEIIRLANSDEMFAKKLIDKH
jgi:hypothetical protein